MGYDFIQEFKSEWKGVHASIEVRRRLCGHIFTAKMNNIFSKRSICGVCGPQKRMKTCLTGFMEKFGRDYDLNEWNDYAKIVRDISNQTYLANIDTLNPTRIKRSRPDLHDDCVNLDHIVPIITGFKNKIPPEVMADIKNLRVIPAVDNLSKKQKLTEEAKILLAEMLAVL